MFSNELIFTLPSGSVAVGPAEIRQTFHNTFAAHPSRQVLRQRLLHTPDTLAGKEDARTHFALVDQEGWHECDFVCGRLLSCGNHHCEERDHRGMCPPCLRSSFEEVRSQFV